MRLMVSHGILSKCYPAHSENEVDHFRRSLQPRVSTTLRKETGAGCTFATNAGLILRPTRLPGSGRSTWLEVQLLSELESAPAGNLAHRLSEVGDLRPGSV